MPRRRESRDPGPKREWQSRRPARRFRWKWLLAPLVSGLILAACGPTLVSRTSLRHTLLGWAAPSLRGKVVLGDLRLSWTRPLEVRNVTVLDRDDRRMLQIARVASDRSLLDLLRQPRNLGSLVVVSPDLHLVVRRDGSNLQDLWGSIARSGDQGPHPGEPAPAVNICVHVSEGHLTVVDEVTGRTTSLSDVQAGFQPSADDVALMTVQLGGRVDDAGRPGKFMSEISWKSPASWTLKDLGAGTGRLQAAHFPLATLKPAYIRLFPDLDVAGDVSGEVQVTWTTETQGPVARMTSRLELDSFEFAAPSILGKDRLVDPRLSIQLDGTIERDFLRIERLTLDSTLVRGSATAAGPVAVFLKNRPYQLVADATSPHELSCQGQIDIPRIAASLPNTLRLKPEMRLEEGSIQFDVGTESVGGVRAFHGRIATERLKGRAGGKEISWEDPITLRWDLASTPQGAQLREVICQSEFLTGKAAGSLEAGDFQAVANLNRLSEHLGEFFDMRGSTIAGALDCQGHWQTTGQQLAGDLKCTVENFVLSTNGGRWREDEVRGQGQWEATVAGSRLVQLRSAALAADLGSDHADCHLRSPVDSFGSLATWPVQVHVTGQLASWLQRLRPWVHLRGLHLEGGVQLTAAADVGLRTCRVAPLQLELTELQAQVPTGKVREPKVVLQADLAWDGAADELILPQATFSCSSLAARISDLRVPQWSKGGLPSGAVAFRGDLGRLATPFVGATLLPSGNVEGLTRFAASDARLACEVRATARPLTLATWKQATPTDPRTGWNPLWHEETWTLEAKGGLDRKEQVWTCESLRMAGDALTVTGHGSLRASDRFAEVSGDLEYDLALLQPKLTTWLGPHVAMSGKQRHPFRIQGPLPGSRGVSPELQAEFELGWNELRGYGISLGPQQLRTRLQNGVADIAPLDINLQGGRLSIDPRLDLSAQPVSLVLDRPATAENLQLTPDLLRGWLKYVAPLLAESTSASGRVSVRVDEARIPLVQPSLSTLAGQVVVEEASLQPGPLAQQFLGSIQQLVQWTNPSGTLPGLLGTNPPLLTVNRQQVDFQLVQGRIHHRNLELHVGDVVVRSQGSVGLDQTLSLLAEVPLRDQWLGKERLLEGLRGQTVKIPVQGTLGQPQIDSHGIAQLMRENVGDTAERVIQGELQKGLQKLLGPK